LCIAPALADGNDHHDNGIGFTSGVPTLTSTGYLMKANMHLTDLTGVGSATNYQYVDLLIATDVAGAVVGTVNLYPTNTVKGVTITRPSTSGAATWVKPAISTSFTMHITKAGTIKFYLSERRGGYRNDRHGHGWQQSSDIGRRHHDHLYSYRYRNYHHRIASCSAVHDDKCHGIVGSGRTPQIALKLADTSGYFVGNLNGRVYLNSNATVPFNIGTD